MTNRLSFLIKSSIAILLGALLTLAFAPYQVFPFAILAMAGLLYLWLNSQQKTAFWLGFFFGMGLFGTGVYWVYTSIHDIGGVPIYFALLITGGFIAILSLFPAAVGYILARYFPITNAIKILCAFPAVWGFSEWVRCWIATGFPWLLLGYSQTNSPLKGFAPVFGVYGVSLGVTLSAGLIVYSILVLKQKRFRAAYFSLLGLACLWLVGSSLALLNWTKKEGTPLSVAMVQGNIPQQIKWSPDYIQTSLEEYAKLTEALWGKDQLIIWPEAAVPLPKQIAANYLEFLTDKAKASGSHLILGIPSKAEDGGYYNTIQTLGQQESVYNKRALVPFGEYTPFSKFFARALNFMNVPMSDMVAGNRFQPPLELANVKIWPSLCYEITFPELMWSHDEKIGLLLTLTNDAWFGQSNAQAQHLQMAAMRALEFERPVLFVSNDGITAVIDPHGKIQSVAPTHQIYVLEAQVQPMVGLTPWMRLGTNPIMLLLLSLLFSAIRYRKQISLLTPFLSDLKHDRV